jgi:hypothetical protein
VRSHTAYHVAATQFAFLASPKADDGAYLDMLENRLKQAGEMSNVRFSMTTTSASRLSLPGKAQGPTSCARRTALATTPDCESAGRCLLPVE